VGFGAPSLAFDEKRKRLDERLDLGSRFSDLSHARDGEADLVVWLQRCARTLGLDPAVPTLAGSEADARSLGDGRTRIETSSRYRMASTY
jgi:hypothetical protein